MSRRVKHPERAFQLTLKLQLKNHLTNLSLVLFKPSCLMLSRVMGLFFERRPKKPVEFLFSVLTTNTKGWFFTIEKMIKVAATRLKLTPKQRLCLTRSCNKNYPNFPKSCPKISHRSFYLLSAIFQNSLKYNFCRKFVARIFQKLPFQVKFC